MGRWSRDVCGVLETLGQWSSSHRRRGAVDVLPNNGGDGRGGTVTTDERTARGPRADGTEDGRSRQGALEARCVCCSRDSRAVE